jgi:hypothetical protein
MHDALAAPGDVNGDGFADLWAREAATGVLWFYSGDGAGGFRTATAVGYGWGMHDMLIPTVDQTGDGRPDLFGRQRSTGDRYLYPVTSGGTPTSSRFGGSGWHMHDTVL